MYFCTVKRNICFFLREPLYILMFFVCGTQQALSADELSKKLDNIDVSLLTCQPHDEVYSLYGHTAIRVKDTNTGQDFVVNYGVFDTRESFFVLRFIFGLTDYTMELFPYSDFLAEYKHFGSGIYEQHINMSPKEKVQFMLALQQNAKEENKVYRYNYFYNNCTTKARDILYSAFDGVAEPTSLSSLQQGERSFRQLVHLGNDDHPWTMWGNDLLLGVGADANTSYEDREFLPRVLAADFDSTAVVYADGTRKPIVSSASWVLAPGNKWHNPSAIDFPLTPTQAAVAVLLLSILYFVVIEGFVIRRPVLWAHYFYVCLYAFVGIVLFLMLFSQHPTVRVNFQILIFNPLFFFFALPKFMKGWGRYALLASIAVFFLGNVFQSYAEGVNILALALLATFTPFYFAESKKNTNFAS